MPIQQNDRLVLSDTLRHKMGIWKGDRLMMEDRDSAESLATVHERRCCVRKVAAKYAHTDTSKGAVDSFLAVAKSMYIPAVTADRNWMGILAIRDIQVKQVC